MVIITKYGGAAWPSNWQPYTRPGACVCVCVLLSQFVMVMYEHIMSPCVAVLCCLQIYDDSLQQIIANFSHLSGGNSDASDAWIESLLSPVPNTTTNKDDNSEEMANKSSKAGAGSFG